MSERDPFGELAEILAEALEEFIKYERGEINLVTHEVDELTLAPLNNE